MRGSEIVTVAEITRRRWYRRIAEVAEDIERVAQVDGPIACDIVEVPGIEWIPQASELLVDGVLFVVRACVVVVVGVAGVPSVVSDRSDVAAS